MALSHSKNVEVNQSTLTDVGRDQNLNFTSPVQIGQISVAINFSLFPNPRQIPCPVLNATRHAPALPIPGIPETSSQARNLVPEGISTIDTAVHLIVQSVQLLIGPHADNSLDKHKNLRLELIALYDSRDDRNHYPGI